MIIIPNSIEPNDFIFELDEANHLRESGREHYGIAKDTIVVGQIGDSHQSKPCLNDSSR